MPIWTGITAALWLLPGPLQADLITIDPDAYAAGADLSEAAPGASLRTITNLGATPAGSAFAELPVYARHNPVCVSDPYLCDATTGTLGFSPFGDAEGPLYGNWFNFIEAANCWSLARTGQDALSFCDQSRNAFRALLIEFHDPTDYVAISGAFLSDEPHLIAFDASFNRLGLAQVTRVLRYGEGFHHNLGHALFSTPVPLISYVVVAAVSGNSSLDNLRYRVSEPSALLLLLVGLASVAPIVAVTHALKRPLRLGGLGRQSVKPVLQGQYVRAMSNRGEGGSQRPTSTRTSSALTARSIRM